MKPERLAALAVAALLAPAAGRAHGIDVEVRREGGTVAVRARYEGGRPLAGARYEVVSPARPERAFDEGTTERHGWVAFVPDAPGAWRVRIVDASGHGRVVEVEVPSAPPAAIAGAPARPPVSAASGAAPREPPADARDRRAAPGASLLRIGGGLVILGTIFSGLFLVLRRRTSAGR
jgi:nickel transport protein